MSDDRSPTPPLAVIIPVMRRPAAVAPLVRSLRQTTPGATAFFVADADDTAELAAIDATPGAVLIRNTGPSRSFATKANLGYRETTEPWLLFVGDDVRFTPGWFEAALEVAGDDHHLIATNDCGNGAVLAGVHATHPLMRRSWVDEQGASWDGPGTVAHEGYRHWFVDNEWTAKARAEGVFAYAPDAVVEHLHPIFGKGCTDDVYRIGQLHAASDQQVWTSRAALHMPDPMEDR